MEPDHGKGAHKEHLAPGKKASQAMPEGHEGMHGDIEAMAEDMYRRLLVSIPLTLLILPYSALVQELTGIELPVPFGLDPNVFMFLLATPVVFYGGWMHPGHHRVLSVHRTQCASSGLFELYNLHHLRPAAPIHAQRPWRTWQAWQKKPRAQGD